MAEGHDAGLNEAIINDTAFGAPFNLGLISFLCCELIPIKVVLNSYPLKTHVSRATPFSLGRGSEKEYGVGTS